MGLFDQEARYPYRPIRRGDGDEGHEHPDHHLPRSDRQLLEEILLGLGDLHGALDEILQYLDQINQREGTMTDDFAQLQADLAANTAAVAAETDLTASIGAALSAKDDQISGQNQQILDLLAAQGVDQETINAIDAQLQANTAASVANNAVLASAVTANTPAAPVVDTSPDTAPGTPADPAAHDAPAGPPDVSDVPASGDPVPDPTAPVDTEPAPVDEPPVDEPTPTTDGTVSDTPSV